MPSEVQEGQCRHLVPLYVPMAVTKARALLPLCWSSPAGKSPAGTQPLPGWLGSEGAEKAPGPPATPCGPVYSKPLRAELGAQGVTPPCPGGSRASTSAGSSAALREEEPCSPAAAQGELAVISHDHPLMTST